MKTRSVKMKRVFLALLTAVVLACCALCFLPERSLPEALRPAAEAVRQVVRQFWQRLRPEPVPDPDADSCEVLYAVDGDTLLLLINGEKVTVRLIGIDAPESVHPEAEKNTPEGSLAAQRLRELTSERRVTLEYDAQQTDRYGRTLAYVYLDGTLLQDRLLSEGLARTIPLEPNTRYEDHFARLEEKAEKEGAGFWGTGFFSSGSG